MIGKIKQSIVLQLLCIVLIILLVFTGYVFISQNYVYRIVHSNSETLCESLLKQTDDALSYYKDKLRYQAANICKSPIIEDLTAQENFKDKEEFETRLLPLYSQITAERRDVVAMFLFDKNMKELAHLGINASLPERRNYLRTEEDFDADQYIEAKDDYNYAFYYPVFSEINDVKVQTGMCVFILEHWLIDGTVRNIIHDSASVVQLSDSNNPVLASYSGNRITEDLTMEEMRSDRDYIYREGEWDNGIRVSVSVCISANTEGSARIRRLVFIAYTVAIILLILLIEFSYLQMAKPISQITGFINRAIRHPDERLNMSRKDDIGVVASSLDKMLDENQKMIQELKEGKIRLYEEQLARQEMEILAYRNQINPHFLYNTLSCMRDMALIHDDDDIADMAMALSDIFRYAVKGSNIVTFRDEVQYIDKYASIINYRFSGKISIITKASDDVLDKPAIRFLLQPLVENSVFHGLEESVDPGHVTTDISLKEGRIEIVVEDDGIGMDEDTLEAVREMLKNPAENSSIGLSNIVQRLRLFYGDDYTFTIDSTLGEGTRIVISIPDHIKS